jgi:hypothetical protein
MQLLTSQSGVKVGRDYLLAAQVLITGEISSSVDPLASLPCPQRTHPEGILEDAKKEWLQHVHSPTWTAFEEAMILHIMEGTRVYTEAGWHGVDTVLMTQC